MAKKNEFEGMSISELILELVGASIKVGQRKAEQEEAREKFLEKGGVSWGYYGAEHFDRTAEAEDKVKRISEVLEEKLKK